MVVVVLMAFLRLLKTAQLEVQILALVLLVVRK